jgi:hypothetical protein
MLLLKNIAWPITLQKIGQERIKTSRKKNNQDGGLFFFILPVIICKHPLEGTLVFGEKFPRALCLSTQAMALIYDHEDIICLTHPVNTFYDDRRVFSLRLIIHGSC